MNLAGKFNPMIPVIIITRNRVTYARQMLEQVSRLPGADPVIVDNASDYPPMREWLVPLTFEACRDGRVLAKRCIRLRENHGCYAPWERNHANGSETLVSFIFDVLGYAPQYYCVTDDDLDLSNIVDNDWARHNVFDMLKQGLNFHTEIIKCGFSIQIDDLPAKYPFRNAVIRDQSKYYNLESAIFSGDHIVYFRANIDTTFAMYRTADLPKMDDRASGQGLRIGKPFVCRHRPWYLGVEDFTEEDWHYLKTTNTYTYWTKLMQDLTKAKGVDSGK